MLASDETIKVVAASLRKFGKTKIVIDPVSLVLIHVCAPEQDQKLIME